jgi:hypothetical protein
MKEVKKFWSVKRENYKHMNDLAGSHFTDKELNDINISTSFTEELNLALINDVTYFENSTVDENTKGVDVFMTFPILATDWLKDNGYIYQGELSIKILRKDKLDKLNQISWYNDFI